jgi:hypothetical protein
MKTFLVCIALTILFPVACKKHHDIEYVSLTYKQTYCSDPWKTGPSDSVTLQNVSHYLDSMGLYVSSLYMQQVDRPAICFACSCTTGKVIYLTTFPQFKAKYEQVGFK